MNPYQILGIAEDASDANIRRAYRKLALSHHPDQNAGSEQASTRFRSTTVAYNTLIDPAQREAVDRQLAARRARKPKQPTVGELLQKLREAERRRAAETQAMFAEIEREQTRRAEEMIRVLARLQEPRAGACANAISFTELTVKLTEDRGDRDRAGWVALGIAADLLQILL